MKSIWGFDAETHSPVNLITHGADIYTRHPQTRCLMFAYHPPQDTVNQPRLWLEGDPPPPAVVHHVNNGGYFSGWNVVGFDRLVWNRKLVPLWGLPELPDDAWIDSMHRAALANRPRSLDGCAQSVGIDFKVELKDSNRIRRITSAERNPLPVLMSDLLNGRVTVASTKKAAVISQQAGHTVVSPELLDDMQWLAARCIQDVILENQVLLRLPEWIQSEPWLNMPYIDRKINDRGILLDIPLVQGLIEIARKEVHDFDREIARLTNGRVEKVSEVEKVKQFLVDNKVPVPEVFKPMTGVEGEEPEQLNDDEDEKEIEAAVKKGSPWRLRKNDVADLLARTDLPDFCHRVLEIRAEASKISTRKLSTMLARAAPDGRLYRTMSLGGAQQTMRWASPGVNLYNTVRDTLGKKDEVAKDNGLDVKNPLHKAKIKSLQQVALNTAIEIGRAGDIESARMLYQAQKKDAQGRLQNHGVLTWCSRMIRRTLTVPDGYVMANGDYAQIEARVTMWLAQQINILMAYANKEDVYVLAAAGIFHTTPDRINAEMRQTGKVSSLALGFGGGPNALVAMGYNYGLLMTLEQALPIVKAWREANPECVKYWYATDDAAANAVMYPGREFPVAPLGLVSYFMDPSGADCLCCRLPSGRWLRYWAPRLTQEYWASGKAKDRLSLSGLTNKGKVVFRRSLYHTILVENQVQGIATADMLGHGLVNMERNSMPVLLHVYDSIASQIEQDRIESVMGIYEACMLDQPHWTRGLPIAADCDYGARFG